MANQKQETLDFINKNGERFTIIVDKHLAPAFKNLDLKATKTGVFFKGKSLGRIIAMDDIDDRNYVVWHINGNDRDFRKCNLEVITQKEKMKRIREKGGEIPRGNSNKTGERYINYIIKEKRYRVAIKDSKGKLHTKRFEAYDFKAAIQWRDAMAKFYGKSLK